MKTVLPCFGEPYVILSYKLVFLQLLDNVVDGLEPGVQIREPLLAGVSAVNGYHVGHDVVREFHRSCSDRWEGPWVRSVNYRMKHPLHAHILNPSSVCMIVYLLLQECLLEMALVVSLLGGFRVKMEEYSAMKCSWLSL